MGEPSKSGAGSVLRIRSIFNASRIAFFLSLTIVGILVIFTLFGDIIAPYPFDQGDLYSRLLPPFWQEGGSLTYPLGTDRLGRDVLSRMILGTKYTLGISTVSIFLSFIFGCGVGLISGYFGGVWDVIVMRLTDVAIGFPSILLGLLFALIFGPSILTITMALIIIQWARFARQIRGEALSLRETDYVAQARIAGCSDAKIILRHLLPNIMNTALVLMTLQVGWAIMMESSLSFLGAGIPPPLPAWGLMVADGRAYLDSAWWISLVPGFIILLTVLSFNTIGDWVRDRLDPRLRQL